jgi:hypothetical protein
VTKKFCLKNLPENLVSVKNIKGLVKIRFSFLNAYLKFQSELKINSALDSDLGGLRIKSRLLNIFFFSNFEIFTQVLLPPENKGNLHRLPSTLYGIYFIAKYTYTNSRCRSK